MTKVGVVIAAGGNSRRMNGTDKLLSVIGGKPVIARACLAFEINDYVSEIVVVTKSENVALVKEILDGCGVSKLTAVLPGGNTRAKSVSNGVSALGKCDYIAIHDGARPFASQELINRCINTAIKNNSAVPAIKSVDTLKSADNNVVLSTVDRNCVFRVQTPQVFNYEKYLSALERFANSNYTDDCSLMEAADEKVYICEGDENNIKITTPNDLSFAEYILNGRTTMIRIGHGYDVHRLVPNRKLIICGVDIPFTKGLLGHSDADVATHAIADSVLGAAALGDIGRLFPDNDPKYEGADSIALLRKVVKLVNSNGYTIGNIDATIVAQSPKLAPYINQMRCNIANACNCDIDAVSIKATTEEGLGFTGSGEGISATAVCIIF